MDAHADEYNTQHDYKPTRAARPDWLEEARQAKVFAEHNELAIIDLYEEGKAEFDAVTDAIAQAEAAAIMYNDLFDYWMRGLEPASVELKLSTLSV